MFYNQPLAVRFGTELLRNVDQTEGVDPYWDQLDIAVAWVRASGVSHLNSRFESFLANGGRLSFVVGVDLQNTTLEGLQALLDFEQHGHAETFVYHNEAGSVFHPKLYLFRNEEEARLIVGSNNLTESGLYLNVEAGLQIDTDLDSEVVVQALDALSSWKDATTRLSQRLDSALLGRLRAGGYVLDEATARARARATRSGTRGAARQPIFGSRRFSAPSRPPTPATAAPPPTTVASPAAPGTVLLMRLRRASATARRTQTQIPLRLFDTYFRGTTSVRSVHTGISHNIVVAAARGGRNTVKLEVPEMLHFVEPVARFDQTPAGMVYEVYDVGTPNGNQIMARLRAGHSTGATQRSISDMGSSTWWQFI